MEPGLELSLEERQLFYERIGRSLDEQPLQLAPEAHRQAVASLIGRVGEASHYELLGVAPGASGDEIHEAYERLARLVHPRNAGAVGLAGRQGVLEMLLERATVGYLVLSHPGRRKEYDRQLGSRLWSAESWGATREEEERAVARRYFAKANVLAAQEEYHPAIELLRQAVRIDPRAEYYTLLGQLQAKNPHWLRHAEESLQKAVDLGAHDAALTSALTRVREMLRGESLDAAAPGEGGPAAKPGLRGKLGFRKRR
jgi:tetratricopeptide (TPR) repeat protein